MFRNNCLIRFACLFCLFIFSAHCSENNQKQKEDEKPHQLPHVDVDWVQRQFLLTNTEFCKLINAIIELSININEDNNKLTHLNLLSPGLLGSVDVQKIRITLPRKVWYKYLQIAY
jgi:hypothetical protein